MIDDISVDPHASPEKYTSSSLALQSFVLTDLCHGLSGVATGMLKKTCQGC
jgi:hypothetical protein